MSDEREAMNLPEMEVESLRNQLAAAQAELAAAVAAIEKHNAEVAEHDAEMEALQLAKKPDTPEAALRVLANWMDALYKDAGTGKDHVQQDLRDFADEVEKLRTQLAAAQARETALREAPAALAGAPEPEPCGECGGDGYTVEPEHDPCCDGACRNCPVPVQVQCEKCEGTEDTPTPCGECERKEGFND